jgi:hypothetical protein
MVMMLGVRSPQSIACGVGASVFRIELYNSDGFVSLFMLFYVILLVLFTYVYYMYETRSCHTYMYALGLFFKTRCDRILMIIMVDNNNIMVFDSLS